jgi:hypothetical protein
MQRPRRVGRDELDVHLPPLPQLRLAEIAVLASAARRRPARPRGQPQVEEARPGDLGASMRGSAASRGASSAAMSRGFMPGRAWPAPSRRWSPCRHAPGRAAARPRRFMGHASFWVARAVYHGAGEPLGQRALARSLDIPRPPTRALGSSARPGPGSVFRRRTGPPDRRCVTSPPCRKVPCSQVIVYCTDQQGRRAAQRAAATASPSIVRATKGGSSQKPYS